jgi:hypothetical protein
MSISSLVRATLDPLVDDRVYPDVGPDAPTVPYITYQQVGGDAVNFLDGEQPSKGNARIQVSVWAATRTEADLLIQRAETAMRGAQALNTTVSGAPMNTADPVTKYRGAIQFFSCWADIPA